MALIQVDGARKKISPKEPISWALPPKRPHPIRPKQLEPEIVSEPISFVVVSIHFCVCVECAVAYVSDNTKTIEVSCAPTLSCVKL